MIHIDVVIPVYNQTHYLLACLLSLLRQTFPYFSVTIVDDGSTEPIAQKVKHWKEQYRPPFPMNIIHQKRRGAAAARNRGAKKGYAKYLLFCDADVILKQDFLKKTYNTLEKHPQHSFCYSSFKYGWKTFHLYPFDKNRLRKLPYIHTTSLIRRKDFPGFDERLKRFQDWDLWLTLSAQGKSGIWIPETLFTVHPGGTMSRWLPSFVIHSLHFLPSVKDYHRALQIIKDKHGL